MKTYVILLLALFCVGCSEPVGRPWQPSFPNENLDVNYILRHGRNNELEWQIHNLQFDLDMHKRDTGTDW